MTRETWVPFLGVLFLLIIEFRNGFRRKVEGNYISFCEKNNRKDGENEQCKVKGDGGIDKESLMF